MDIPTPSVDPSDDGLVHIARLLYATESFASFLEEFIRYVAAQTGSVCSITVCSDDDRLETMVSSDELTLRLDLEQYDSGDGPILEVMETTRPVVVVDLTAEARWPGFTALGTRSGIRSAMAFPVIATGRTVGVLNLYAQAVLGPDDDVTRRAAQLADYAGGALAVGRRIGGQDAESPDLRNALTARTAIDQAIGILMAQQHCSAETAFELMRTTAQGRNIKLRDVAAQIVASVQRRSPGRSGRY